MNSLGLLPCTFYMCLLNPSDVEGALVWHLCPVCLRKVAALLGSSWDVTAHYQSCLSWMQSENLPEESTWYQERLQVVLGSFGEMPPIQIEDTLQGDSHDARPAVRTPNPTKRKSGTPKKKAAPPTPARSNTQLDGNIEVVLSGRKGILSSMNGAYWPYGGCNSQRAFCKDAGQGRQLYLFYMQELDSWVIGPRLGDQCVFADCGPANDDFFGQTWRVWDGTSWMEDPKIHVEICACAT